METAALVIAILALLIALRAAAAAGSLKARLEQTESAARSALMRTEEIEQNSKRNEEFLKRMAAGGGVDADMIEEGRLFPEVDSEKLRKLVEVEKPKDLKVVDVRTEQEVAGGHIEGVLWIPVDQLEQRSREIPKQGQVMVVCAAGGRSAAACDYLSTRGWSNVTNVIGGMSAYRGKMVEGLPKSS